MSKYLKILTLTLLLALPVYNYAQVSANHKKEYKEAKKYFDDEDYDAALEILLDLEKKGENSVEIKYKIGVCYLQSILYKNKAIPYLEYAINSNELEVPADIYLELGKLYHEQYNFDLALLNYNKYLYYATSTSLYLNYAERMVKTCQNAKNLLNDTLDVSIESIGSPVNTMFSEYSPFISADGKTIYYNKVTYLNKNYLSEGVKQDSLIEIMMSQMTDNGWSEPEKIAVESNFKNPLITLEGITPDGQQLFVNINIGDESNLYSCYIDGNTCRQTELLGGSINSEFWDGRVSQTPDGSELYFSSDRPGGYGEKDIYKITKDKNGNWSDEPINLGPAINTFYDENSPFIHPDKKTLFFSSEGHMAIGGFDIYKSVNKNDLWSYAENMGYPINTTKDELYFVLSADGKSGYFSSTVNDKYGNHDIYQVAMQANIPLTLVKGTILAGDPPEPTNAKIKVIDRETNQRVKYIYNPNPITGKYLMIFPPGKNYDMIVEAPNFLPQLINIYIPDQTYFYELYQEIVLKHVNSLGKELGEQIIVNNTFYDIYNTAVADSINIDSLSTSLDATEKDYNNLLKLIEDIITTTDSVGIEILDEEIDLSLSEEEKMQQQKDYENLFNLVEEAINTTDSVSLIILDRNTLYEEKSLQTFFYAEDESQNNLVEVEIDGETILTTPPINTVHEDEKKPWPDMPSDTDSITTSVIEEKKPIDVRSSTPKERKVIYTTHVFFDSNKDLVDKKYFYELNQVAELIVNNPKIGVLLLGYTDSKGEDDDNLVLSNKRVTSVLKYLIDKGITNKQAILKGVGETKSKNEQTELDRRYNRRVDIKVFELINN